MSEPTRLESRELGARDYISIFYISLFGRAPDAEGFEYWTLKLALVTAFKGDEALALEDVVWGMRLSSEYKDMYEGLTPEQQVNRLYQNLFSRDADPDGLAFWSNKIAQGQMAFTDIAYLVGVLAFIGGAGINPNDTALMRNKVDISIYVAEELKTNNGEVIQNAFDGLTANPESVIAVADSLFSQLNPVEEPEPESPANNSSSPDPAPDTTAPTIRYSIVSGPALSIESSEVGTAGLYTGASDSDLVGTAIALQVADTRYNLTLAAQPTVTNTVLKVFDTAGNMTVPTGRTFLGTTSADSIVGTAGDDDIFGFDDNDTLTGGAGADIINAGGGNNSVLDAGEGLDEIIHDTAGASVAITVTGADGALLEATELGASITIANGINAYFSAEASTEGVSIQGGNGNDSIYGGGGNDTISGGAGNDQFDAGGGTSIVTDAGVGADFIFHRTESATVAIAVTGSGVVGIEAYETGATATISNGVNGNVSAHFSTAAVRLNGGDGNDSLRGGAGNDTISGGAGNDTIRGGLGSDVINAGDGANQITDLGNGADQVTHNAGVGSTVSVEIIGTDLVTLTASSSGATVQMLDASSNSKLDASSSSAAITVVGNSGNESITAGSGNDTIDAAGGNDTITGGAGADDMAGGDGDDIFLIADEVHHSAGEIIAGGNGTDILRYTATDGGNLVLQSGTSVEQARISEANGTNTGTTPERIDASNVIAAISLFGNNGDNTLIGNDQANTIEGAGGADLLVAGAGNDVLLGGLGDDTFIGGVGADSMTGGDGNDVFVYQNINESTVITAFNRESDFISDFVSGEDRIVATLGYESSSTDLVFDARVLQSQSGTLAVENSMSGGIGQAVYDTANRGLWVDGDGDSNVDTSRDYFIRMGSSAPLTVIDRDVNFIINSGSGNDVILVGAGDDTVNAGAGDDSITGGAGADNLAGGDGDDIFLIADKNHHSSGEIINGGNGTDILRYTATDGLMLILQSGTSVEQARIAEANGSNTGTTSESIDASNVIAAISLFGNNGDNTLIGNDQANTIEGAGGADLLSGAGGNDLILGGGGNDIIIGGAGADSLTGGDGVDRFVYTTNASSAAAAGANMDTIADFTVAQGDLIVLTFSAATAANSTTGIASAASTVGAMAAAIADATAVATVADVYTALTAGLTAGVLAASTNAAGGTVAQVVTFANGAAAGTYLVINDGFAGFQAANDVVISLQGAPAITAASFAYDYIA